MEKLTQLIYFMDLLYVINEKTQYENDAKCLQNVSKKDFLKLVIFCFKPKFFDTKFSSKDKRFSFLYDFSLSPALFSATKGDLLDK